MLSQFYEILEVEEESMYGHPVPDDQFHEYIDSLALALGRKFNTSAISDIASKIGPKTDLSKLGNKMLWNIFKNPKFQSDLHASALERGPLGATQKSEYSKYQIIKKCVEKKWIHPWYDLDDPYFDSEEQAPQFWGNISYHNLPPECRKEIPDAARKEFCGSLLLYKPELSDDINSTRGVFQVLEIGTDSEEVLIRDKYTGQYRYLVTPITFGEQNGNKRVVKYKRRIDQDGFNNIFVGDIIFIHLFEDNTFYDNFGKYF
jgi:hypothetical protein